MSVNKKRDTSWLSENGKKIGESILIRLYEIHEKQFRAHLDLHYKNRNYYMTLISALLATFVAGVLQFHKEVLSFILLIIPISVVLLSELAKKTMDRYYLSFLESVVIMAKIEHMLGLDKPVKSHKSKSSKILWSKDEQFVLDRWVKGRYEYDSSEQFVNERMRMGDNRYAHWVFTILEVIAGILGFFSLWILLQLHFN